MSRNGSGTYTLPSGNPVVSGTLIEATWANSTLSDIASALTDSLSRSGQGGMTAAFRAFDGTSSVPGIAWGSETTTGWYRAGAGDMRLVVTGSEVIRYQATGVAVTGTLSVTGAITATGGVTGNASTATALQTARTIWGQSFNGTANVSGALTGVTDLTASGSLTLNGGTANGVAYLNGSKVLTTGSALTFNGTRLDVNTGTTGPSISVQGGAGAGNEFSMGADSSGGFWQQLGGLPVRWFVNGSEQMRLTSTGLGIGTSSPSAKLEIYNSAVNGAFVPNTLSTWRVAQIRNDQSGTSGSAAGIAFVGKSDTQPAGIVAINGNTTGGVVGLGFLTVSSNEVFERMRLDSVGNLGLGVTPSPWASDWKVMQIGSRSAFAQYNSNASAFVANNVYYAGTGGSSPTYINTAAASMYQQVNGAHNWFTAPSGTAGNAISFTQAMTLDASGNLGVGTSSPTAKLDVFGGSGAALSYVRAASGQNSFLSVAGNGNTPISTSFDIIQDTLNQAQLCQRANAPMLFFTNNIERARIDSSGNLLVGTTTNRGVGGLSVNPNTSAGAADITFNRNSTTSTSFVIGFQNAGSTVGYISYNNTATTYATSSDARLKQNSAAADDSGAIVDSIQIRKFDWIVDGSHQRYGVIAQELINVFPEAVAAPENADLMMGVDYSKMVPLLVKEIQSLRARVAALESN